MDSYRQPLALKEKALPYGHEVFVISDAILILDAGLAGKPDIQTRSDDGKV